MLESVQCLATWLESGQAREIFHFPKTSIEALGPIQPPVKGWGADLTTQFHTLPRLRMGGATPLRPLYEFIERTGKILPFF